MSSSQTSVAGDLNEGYAETLLDDQLVKQGIATALNNSTKFVQFVDLRDVRSELHTYILGVGKKHVEGFLKENDEFRLTRALCGVARQYCEQEKAQKSGYNYDDIAWYSPEKLADLVPIALSDWDGLTGEQEAGNSTADPAEGGTLLAMIADVRRALGQAKDWAGIDDFDPLTEVGMERLRRLADRLGGDYPSAPGYSRRRSLSNRQAQDLTRSYE